MDKRNVFYIVLDNENPNWCSNPSANRLWITALSNNFNQRLIVRGHLFLNEVLDAFGLRQTGPGALMGWFWEAGSLQVSLDIVTFTTDRIELRVEVDGFIYEKLPVSTEHIYTH